MQETAEKWPVIVKRGGAEVKIYRTKNRGHPNYQVAWYLAGKRQLKNSARFNDARTFANEQASLLSAGQLGVARMDEADREAFVAANRLLKSLGTPLLEAVKSYVAATEALRGHGSLLDAAKEYAERQKRSVPLKPVTEVVEEFISIRKKMQEQERASSRDVATLRSHLRRFAGALQKPIQSVQVRDVNEWLRANSKQAKTFNNMRTSLIRLFHFGRDQGYLAQSDRTTAELVKREKIKGGDITTFSPATLRTLLKDASEEACLWLTLAAFTGMRSAELLRLHWHHIDFEAGVIRLPCSITKGGTPKRQFPILPNLREWLAPFAGREGLVFSSQKASVRTVAYAKGKGIKWLRNWARHSFGTYRSTITKSVGQVCLEMGNSESIVKRHYFDQFANEKDANDWFAIVPDRPKNDPPMKGAA